ncbi:mitochondrial potassium channel [Hyla sarda]|uniref:mitochondrial potassium channel n=1 Tax=Hyla sarda TaxID=327740 RepID=UPI0024C23D6C|nr:mitochondrial potassium channel [Hyla sarda]XP_056380622.1 mitochondrial potassium channel [Hyla sarda]XP_056380623.1 mitochondrial potassium channel [Hyla sarda]
MKHLCGLQVAIGGMKPLHPSSVLLTHRIKLLTIRTLCSPSSKPPDVGPPSEVSVVSPLKRWVEAGKTVGRNSMQKASATAKYWWDRYEEFVGVVEVREAQWKVTEAEKDFMVARGIVREARENVESQQVKLKEVRDRLDRVSRDDVQYLELATLEHKLLQEEKRLRTSYINAEESEREKFALFSASVRGSHEKERTRAERTKNWSIIGSVLGAIIGVMGSTYINRVRLQELKNLLLEAQKGPISLQEAIHEHASVHQSQQKDLGDLVTALRNMISTAPPLSQDPQSADLRSPASSVGSVDQVLSAIKEHMIYTKETGENFESLQQKYGNLEKSLGKIATDIQNVKSAVIVKTKEGPIHSSVPRDGVQEGSLQNVILELSDAEQRLGAHINRNSIYSTALTCSVLAISFPVLYILLKGN